MKKSVNGYGNTRGINAFRVSENLKAAFDEKQTGNPYLLYSTK